MLETCIKSFRLQKLLKDVQEKKSHKTNESKSETFQFCYRCCNIESVDLLGVQSSTIFEANKYMI